MSIDLEAVRARLKAVGVWRKATHEHAKPYLLALRQSGQDVPALLAEVERQAAVIERVGETTDLPAVSMAMTVALAQIERGEDVTPNVAVFCILALRDIRADMTSAALGDRTAGTGETREGG